MVRPRRSAHGEGADGSARLGHGRERPPREPMRALAALILAFALLSCGPSRDAYPYVRQEHCPPDCDASVDSGHDGGRSDAGPPVVPDEPLEDWDTTDAGPLSGIFALEVAVLANVVVDLETRQLYRVRMLQHGTNVRVRLQACVIDLASIRGLADLHFTPATESAIRSHVIDLEGGYLSAMDPVGATFAPPRTFVTIGANLAMPETDPLPTMADPTLALDEDADGNPGVTIDATAVVCDLPEQVFASFRASIALSGVVGDIDSFDGTVDPTVEQTVLGYTDECLRVAANLVVMIRPGSVFHARRVGDAEDLDHNGNVSCPEVAWAGGPLFGEYWIR
jgi:hypothetical protein